MRKKLEVEVLWQRKNKKEKLRNFLSSTGAKIFIEHLINDPNVVFFEWKKI